MKLAYLDPNPSPEQRTVPLQILQNVDAFAQNGADVFLLTPKGLATASDVLGHAIHKRVHHQPIKNLKKSWWYWSGSNRYFYQAATRWVETIQPQVIYVRNLKLAYHLLQHTSIPIFFEPHEIFSQSFIESHSMTWRNRRKLARLEQMEKSVYRQCRGLIAITKVLADDLRQRYDVSTPILVAPSGYDHQLVPTELELSYLPQTGKTIILYLGSLHPWKGLDILLDAIPHLHPQGEVWIAGGTLQDITMFGSDISKRGISNRVKVLGHVDFKDRFDVIRQAHICVHPLTLTSIGSRYTSPLKIFEYMAMGKAIVTAQVPAIEEILTHEQTALLVPPQNHEQLAKALNQLMDNDPLYQQLSHNAYQTSLNYTWGKRIQNILAFIQSHLT